MARYYMANTVFQPYTYEQLYTTAKELTAAHNEQESKLGALDTAAAGVEPYLDPEAHPEDKAMYDAIKGYRNGLNDITYHLASRGLSGHVYNNVMSLASDYANKVKPVEGAVENYKKAHDMRVGILAQNPDYIPRYSWDRVSVSENLNGVSQRAIEGFKGTQYMNDITTTLQKLFNDFGLTRRKDIRIFGQQVFDMISNGMPAETALMWFADQTQLSPEDRAKLMLGLDTVNQRYDINGLQNSNPAVMGELAGYQKQGIINAIGTHELKTYENLWDKVAANVSQARRIKAIEEPQKNNNITPYPGSAIYRPSNTVQERALDLTEIEIGKWPASYDVRSTVTPSKIGDVFSNRMKQRLGKKYQHLLNKSPQEIYSANSTGRAKFSADEQKAYSDAYKDVLYEKSFLLHDDPIRRTLTNSQTINAFVANNKNNLIKITDEGTLSNEVLGDDSNFSNSGLDAMGVSFIPSTYNVYPNIKNKEDYVFITLSDNGTLKDYAIDKRFIVGRVNENSEAASLEKQIALFKMYNSSEVQKNILNNYSLFSEAYFKGEDRNYEDDINMRYVNAIETAYIGSSEETKNTPPKNKN